MLGRITGLDDAAGARAAFQGADVVVHLAARVHVMRETSADALAEFRRVNVDGTRSVLTAAREAGVKRFLYVSTIKVNGESRDAPYSEVDVPRPVDLYGQSKLEAERLVQLEDGGMKWTVLRPPLVYGPGVGGNFRRLLWLAGLASRWPLPLGGIENLRSMIFVENLAAAISTAIAHPMASNQTFLVSDQHDISVSELVRQLALGLGGRARLFHAPMKLMRWAGVLFSRTPDIERLLGTLRVDSSLIHSTLGWTPPVNLHDALGITSQWWRAVQRP